MKNLLLASMMAMSASAFANHPDSVYVKTINNGPGDGVRVAYSVDKRTWTPISKQLFSSDFGTWGAQKKMYSPVLSYDGKKFYAEFLVGENIPQIAKTESSNLQLWKPQDYPYLSATEFEAKKKELKEASKNNILRVPYYIIEDLVKASALATVNAQRDAESVRLQALEGKDAIHSTLSIDLNDKKEISPELFGIFFEDINYSADGGLYAELVQNRDFEYNRNDRGEWNPMTAWKVEGEGVDVKINTENPIHKNNSHYATLTTTKVGGKLVNTGWDGIAVNAGEKYNLSIFTKGSGKIKVSLMDGDKAIASTTISASKDWKMSKASLTASSTAKNAILSIEPLQTGELSVDFVSLFPKDTFKGRANGLRKDLAQTLADLKPQFIRFPGGCMSHGNGIDNIYHWQATVGELWERQPDFNTWGYHQTRGLGFYEYFQYCEDIGATPLPVLAAGVPCQNSSKGGHGQMGGIPFEKDLNGKPSPYTYNGKPLTMESYLQELIDLIEWANGDAKTSELAKIRAKAGHPKPFGLKYLGIGNEDLLGDTFNERFTFLYNGVKAAHPEITIVGTVGPFWEGSDYEFGWKEAKAQNVPIVDEHYYNPEGWYLNHQDFYDKYERTGTKVYLGEWASKGNNLSNALAEAIHITNVERNAEVVVMSSYAPLLAKEGHTQWNPDLIYFNNTEVKPTPNYWVQMMCGQNAGDEYVYSTMNANDVRQNNTGGRPQNIQPEIDKRVKTSVVADKETGDLIIKVVNALPVENNLTITPSSLEGYNAASASITSISGNANDRNIAKPTAKTISLSEDVKLPAYSFSVIRISKQTTKKK